MAEPEAPNPEAGKPDKLTWILRCGWRGLCPRCGEGKMFTSWLKLAKTCDKCGLDYRFATPDDGPAFFAQCVVALPLVFVFWLQIAHNPPLWVHIVVSLPLTVAGILLPLRPIKGWLVASQYMNKAQQAGTEAQWESLHSEEEARNRDSLG